MSFIYVHKTSTLSPFLKPCIVLNLAVWHVVYIQSALLYNPEVVLQIGSAKSDNYKYKTSKKLNKKYLPIYGELHLN